MGSERREFSTGQLGWSLAALLAVIVYSLDSCVGTVFNSDGAPAEDPFRPNAVRDALSSASLWRHEQRRNEERAYRDFLAKVDRSRLPEERVKMTIELLSGLNTGTPAVCRARELLNGIPARRRGEPEIAKAFALLRAREAPILRRLVTKAQKDRGIVCADGRGSSCKCAESWQGCCSHHGGVAGCTPLPTKIECTDSELASLRGY
jgi:hypothetical protein